MWFAPTGGAGFKKDAAGNLARPSEFLGVGEAVVAAKSSDGLALVLNE